MKGVPVMISNLENQRSRSRRHTRCDTVGIERFLLWELLSFTLRLLVLLPGVSCGSEPTTSLLVHLCPRGHTVNRHEEDLLRLDLGEEVINVREYGEDDLFLGYAIVDIVLGGRRVRTVVDDTVLPSAMLWVGFPHHIQTALVSADQHGRIREVAATPTIGYQTLGCCLA
jgi:hypothetical protein